MRSDHVLVTDCDLPGASVEQTLEAAGLVATRSPHPDPEAIVSAGADATALVVQWAPITGELLDRMPNVRFISRLGIGYDMIDVAAATERGIAVANTPSYCIEEVATHTLAMLLGQARGLAAYDRRVRSGAWSAVTARPMATRPSTSTVSVIGFGRIGSLVAAGCAALGFRVLVADPYAGDDLITAAGHTPVGLADAIAEADLLTLHAPLTAETTHLLDAASIATMKAGAVIVNTCRGPLIDEEALADAIESGHLGGAALDVFAFEPLPADSRLRAFDSVMLTPHAAWFSPAALIDLPVHAATNVIDFLAGRGVGSIVNPEVLLGRPVR